MSNQKLGRKSYLVEDNDSKKLQCKEFVWFMSVY